YVRSHMLPPIPFHFTTLFRSDAGLAAGDQGGAAVEQTAAEVALHPILRVRLHVAGRAGRGLLLLWLVSGNGHGDSIPRRRRVGRSEEHTSELQSRENLVCRLL